MEKSRGLFAEDFGSFMRPGSDALGFSSKFESVIEMVAGISLRARLLCVLDFSLKCDVFH